MEQTKKPLLQTVLLCLPQKKLPNLSNSAEADLDFSFPIIDERQMVGGVSRIKWMWFSSPLISEISHWLSTAKAFKISNRKSRFSEVSI